MIRPFNLAKIKQARGPSSPEAFQPPGVRGDPYRRRRPGDGRGQSLNMPGDEGLAGSPPQGGGYGSKDRLGYPTGISAFEDPSDKSEDKIPVDKDPDHPFKSDLHDTEGGTGIVTDYGLELHDNYDAGSNFSIDSALGRHQTVMDMVDGNNRDRPTPYNNMQKKTPLFDRIRMRQKGQ
jgi:hypothetical protein